MMARSVVCYEIGSSPGENGLQYAFPQNAPKKARNIRPFGEANRNSPPLISPAFSSCVPGSFSGFPPPYSGRNSRSAVPPDKRLSRRRHRCEAPGKCFRRQGLPPVPGSEGGLPLQNTGNRHPSSISSAYSRRCQGEGTARFPRHSWHTFP